MFIFDKPMNHKEINSYLDAHARVKKEDGLSRKAKKIADERKKGKRV
jgi:hypothetical protein